MKAVVLLSGGLDSMACVHFYLKMGYEVCSIFCDYGQPAASQEKEYSRYIANYFKIPYRIIEIKNIHIPEKGEIFGRNAMLAIAALFGTGSGTYKIIIGVHSGTNYPDCTMRFVESVNRVFDVYANGTVLLEAPFVMWKKGDIVLYCKENDLPYRLTYSCEAGGTYPCGECLSCLDRKEFIGDEV